MAEKLDSLGLIAMIDAKIAALQQMREGVIAAMNAGAFGAPGEESVPPPPSSNGTATPFVPSSAPKAPVELPTGVFRGKGLADAVRLYLSIAKRKQTLKEIKTALMDGGLATTSEFFDQTLSSTMHRMRKGGELLQFKDGWDLADSYPESLRQRMSDMKDAPKRKKPKAKKKADAPKKAAPVKAEAKAADKPKATDADAPILKAVV